MKRTLNQLLLPLLSQNGIDKSPRNDTEEASPQNDDDSSSMKRKKVNVHNHKVQSILAFSLVSSGPKSTTCTTCGMCYYNHFEKDRALHSEYHSNFMNGLPWVTSKNQKIISMHNVLEPLIEIKDMEKLLKRRKYETPNRKAQVILADKKSKLQCARVEEILTMVNRELNALSAAEWWKLDNDQSLIQGKAFVVIINGRTAGICITDPILDPQKQCRWMVHRTQKVVARQVNKLIKVGVSRIWVCHKWRRRGLANLLLDAVLSNSIYGITLSKDEIGFSQPSFAGGLLAKNFNGVLHKSGEVLIPVYIEE